MVTLSTLLSALGLLAAPAAVIALPQVDWHRVDYSGGPYSVNVDAACKNQYGPSHSARVVDGTCNGWTCFSAITGGGVGVDLQSACYVQYPGYGPYNSIYAQCNGGVYGWQCVVV